MPIRIDPEESETHSLLEHVGSLTGKHVLEIGAGDGRLTWRYASGAAYVTALDPKADKLAIARKNLPESLRDSVTFLCMDVQSFELPPISSGFDVAIMSWSL